jgi:hypothetical protein
VSARWRAAFGDWLRLVTLSARLVAGRRFWLAPLVPALWPGCQALFLLLGWREESFAAVHAQNVLVGVPLALLAVALGVRVIAGEMDRRTLEVAYTVPGGAVRVWLPKLAAVVGVLVAAEALLALLAWLLFTSYPPSALVGALQAALVYLALATGAAALFRSEITGAMAVAGVLLVNGVLTGFGEHQGRFSPFFNPLAADAASPSELLAWTVQNRLGMVLAIAALLALAVARGERREKLLAG